MSCDGQCGVGHDSSDAHYVGSHVPRGLVLPTILVTLAISVTQNKALIAGCRFKDISNWKKFSSWSIRSGGIGQVLPIPDPSPLPQREQLEKNLSF